MIRTSTGNIRVTKIAQKAMRRKGNRKNTTAKADSSETTILPSAITSAIPAETASMCATGGAPVAPCSSTRA